jgi:hypothetical protein
MEHDMEGELRRIEPVLTEIIGRPSRWSRLLIGRDLRWRTLIHELLHSYSAGYNSPDYDAYRGWEEGVVEQLQRLLRQAALTRIGVAVTDAVFEDEEASHRYNPFIAALEALRAILGTQAETFYLDLLAAPIRDRPGLLLGPGLALPPLQRTEYVKAFSRSDATLKERGL